MHYVSATLHSDIILHLVDIEQTVGDDLHGEVLLELILIDGVLALLVARHVVAQVPHVQLAVRLLTQLCTTGLGF